MRGSNVRDRARLGLSAAVDRLRDAASSQRTRELLGWQPKQPGLIPDLDRSRFYFAT
jgi:hypothetical protein